MRISFKRGNGCRKNGEGVGGQGGGNGCRKKGGAQKKKTWFSFSKRPRFASVQPRSGEKQSAAL